MPVVADPRGELVLSGALDDPTHGSQTFDADSNGRDRERRSALAKSRSASGESAYPNLPTPVVEFDHALHDLAVSACAAAGVWDNRIYEVSDVVRDTAKRWRNWPNNDDGNEITEMFRNRLIQSQETELDALVGHDAARTIIAAIRKEQGL